MDFKANGGPQESRGGVNLGVSLALKGSTSVTPLFRRPLTEPYTVALIQEICSKSALASCKSGVSKPSVNHS